jgi:VanZ family protein
VKSLIFYWLPLLVCAGLIYYFSSLSHPPDPLGFHHADKLYHIIEYTILGILVTRLLRKCYTNLGYNKLKIFAISLSILYGISDEFHQYFVNLRDASLFDLVADGIGSFFGASLYISLYSTDKRKK